MLAYYMYDLGKVLNFTNFASPIYKTDNDAHASCRGP